MTTEWQSIETAPKTGAWILVWVPEQQSYLNSGPARTVSVHWSRPDADDHSRGRLSERARAKLDEAGGFWSISADGFKPVWGKPSHWMPSPDAPA